SAMGLRLADILTGVTLIPSLGEFAYATDDQNIQVHEGRLGKDIQRQSRPRGTELVVVHLFRRSRGLRRCEKGRIADRRERNHSYALSNLHSPSTVGATDRLLSPAAATAAGGRRARFPANVARSCSE